MTCIAPRTHRSQRRTTTDGIGPAVFIEPSLIDMEHRENQRSSADAGRKNVTLLTVPEPKYEVVFILYCRMRRLTNRAVPKLKKSIAKDKFQRNTSRARKNTLLPYKALS